MERDCQHGLYKAGMGSSRVLSDFAEKYGSKNRVLAGFGIGGKAGERVYTSWVVTERDKGTGTKPGVPDVPKYDSKSDKVSWGDSEKEDDDDNDEDDTEDDEGNDDNNDDSDSNDDDDDDDTNDDKEETDSDRTESDRIKIPVLNQSSTKYHEEKEEKIDDEEKMDEEEDDEVTKELYNDVNLLNLENPSLDDNEIASLTDTTTHHEEPMSQTLSLYAIPITATPEVTSVFTITIPPQPPFFNPLSQQATPTPTPTTSEATNSFPSLLDFSYVFKFNDRFTNLEKDMSEIKQVDQEEAQAEKMDYIELVDTLMRAILKEEKNVTESLEDAVLARSFSQSKSTYEAVASLSKFELTKILIDKMEKNKRVETTETKIKTPQLDQIKGQKEGSQAWKLSHPDIHGQRKRSLQAPQKTPPTLNISLLANLPMQRSQVIQLMTQGVQQDQEFDTSNNDEQPADKEVSKDDWFKKPERPSTLDSNWNKRQHVDFRPPQTWISQVARAKEPRTSFDELVDTSFDFSAFVLNRLSIKELT
ncbi:hypothetical protein Tco_0247700 [Tanacetum coccineum]